jgi:hypothetical protein
MMFSNFFIWHFVVELIIIARNMAYSISDVNGNVFVLQFYLND